MKRRNFLLLAILLLLGIFSVIKPMRAYAFQVEPLPADNLVVNPWFRNASEPTRPGFDSWTNVDNYWTLSQKESNPSPDAFIAGKCGTSEPTYCGTAAKLAADDGNAIVGVDSYLYQIVPADPTHRKLKFFVHWVAHYIDPFEVNVYGSDQADGPWHHVWTPLNQVVLTLLKSPPGEDTNWLWKEMTSWTPPVDTILPNGYLFYKVEIRANLPKPDGFKLTGVYFTALPEEATPTPTPTSTATASGERDRPTATPTPGSESIPTATPTPSASPTLTITPSLTPSLLDSATPTPTPTPGRTQEASPTPTNTSSKTR